MNHFRIPAKCAMLSALLASLLASSPVRTLAQGGNPPEVLNNKNIIAMVAVGLPEGFIQAKIDASTVDFDLTTTGLVELSDGKVSPSIVKAMILRAAKASVVKPAPPAPQAAAPTAPIAPPAAPAPVPLGSGAPAPAATAPAATNPAASAAATAAPAAASSAGATPAASAAAPMAPAPPVEPRYPTEAGIYIVSGSGGGESFTMVEPTNYTLVKTGGLLGSLKNVATAGLASADMKAVIRGSTAIASTTDKSPTFLFVFDNANSTAPSATFGTATRPNEFSLITLDAVAGGRQTVLYSSNGWGAQEGAQDAKRPIDLLFSRVKAGVYKVMVKNPLARGEYSFVVPVASQSKDAAAGMNKLWDFAIR